MTFLNLITVLFPIHKTFLYTISSLWIVDTLSPVSSSFPYSSITVICTFSLTLIPSHRSFVPRQDEDCDCLYNHDRDGIFLLSWTLTREDVG